MKKTNPKEGNATTSVQIKPPNMRTIEFRIEGTAPLCIHRFSQKSMSKMEADQASGAKKRSKDTKREAKDFDTLYEDAKHVANEGWCGISAASFRNAAISACRVAGYVMSRARLAVFIEADGYDRVDGVPLVRITHGDPEKWVGPVRNASGVVDLRARPLWREWGATLRVTFDADLFEEQDVINLFMRAGMQVGVGEGRPDSKNSNGLGYGLFRILNTSEDYGTPEAKDSAIAA